MVQGPTCDLQKRMHFNPSHSLADENTEFTDHNKNEACLQLRVFLTSPTVRLEQIHRIRRPALSERIGDYLKRFGLIGQKYEQTFTRLHRLEA